MDDFQGFPTFQFSFFPHGKDGEQLVVRGNKFDQFVLDIEEVKSQFSEGGKHEPIEKPKTDVCPICGSATVAGTSKDGTKKFIKCSTNKWNRDTQQAEGCNYIKWL